MRRVSKTVLALTLVLPGCASVQRGLDQVQAGLAQADIATDEVAERFQKAVDTVRSACGQTEDPDRCMDDLGLTNERLDKVCKLGIDGERCSGGVAYDLDQAYREGTKAAAKASEAWGELEPHLEAVEAAAKQVKDGLDK